MFSWLRPRPVSIACAANEPYARGLAVAVRTLGERTSRPLDVTVLDGGILPETWDALRASWKGLPVSVRRTPLDLARFAGLPLSQGMQPHTYARLLLAELLPDRTRALYLDADILALRDPAELWEADLEGRMVAAAPDRSAPTVSAPAGLRAYAELGLDPATPYCNAGVLVADLDRWRRQGLEKRFLDFARRHPEAVRWWDQDVLNATLAGAWTPLDPRWNDTSEAAMLLGWRPAEGEARAGDAWIVHFLTRYKPWFHACPHPRTQDWLEALDRTAWKGWRPGEETRMGMG